MTVVSAGSDPSRAATMPSSVSSVTSAGPRALRSGIEDSWTGTWLDKGPVDVQGLLGDRGPAERLLCAGPAGQPTFSSALRVVHCLVQGSSEVGDVAVRVQRGPCAVG